MHTIILLQHLQINSHSNLQEKTFPKKETYKMKNQTIGSLLLILSCLLIATPSPTHARKFPDATATAASAGKAWVRTIVRGSENITQLHFYVHDVRAGANATLYGVANASITATSPTSFGQVNVFDDLVTAEPDIAGAEVARAQGTTASAGLEDRAVAISMNFYITSGEFAGSTVSIAGRNPVTEASRELPVIGGTGAFRYARGYAVTTTYLNDAETNYSVLEYTVYVSYSNVALWMDM
ncbi:dirigent protein 21-like [Salvia miltiorrhiza]|uniref:dirigent protein 21-like n=1 Tax=Salvia miltiorrhiza TaxID=226208 RepID=UPI0025AD8204|nr:dirigent protein 21-like [Salvia miltiorrhiza]